MWLLLECPPDAAQSLSRELSAVGERMGLRVTVIPQERGQHAVRGLPYQLKTYSMDQPGIVARLTKVLRDNGVNIEDLSARQESAAFAGSALFLAACTLTGAT